MDEKRKNRTAPSDLWMKPENLVAIEADFANSPIHQLPSGGDFASYAIANRGTGLEQSGIESHNLVHVDGRVALYRAILRRRFRAIGDMGCGLGMTTDALRRHFGSDSADGYEVSTDAVEFANRTFAPARFHRVGVDENTRFGRRFDLILCQELYAFTRTNEWVLQHAMIVNLMDHLMPSGVLLIELSERDAHSTILANLEQLRRICAVQGWSCRQVLLPYDRVWRKIPVLPLARLASRLLTAVKGADANVAILVGK